LPYRPGVVLVLHANPRSSNAQKVRFLLAELGLPHELREVPFGDTRPDWHVAVNPLGGIPALVDGDLRLAESHAILRYLAAREGRDDLYPSDLRARARVDWILDAVATSLREATRPFDAAAYGWRRRQGIGSAPAADDGGAAALAEATPVLLQFAHLLDASRYACHGRFTLADVAAAPYLHRIVRSGNDLTALRRYTDWAEAVLTRPAWGDIAVRSGV
jgi:glutathione S-transferase